MHRTLEERLSRMQSSHSGDDPSNEDKTELSPGPSNQARNMPEGTCSESPGCANMDVGSNTDIVRLPGEHVDACLYGVTSGDDSNDYFKSDLLGSVVHFQNYHQLGSDSLKTVGAFAGVGAFGTG